MQKEGDIFLLNDNGEVIYNYNDDKFYSYELKCLKRYLLKEGFNLLEDDFIILFFDKKWLCKPSYFKIFDTFKGIK